MGKVGEKGEDTVRAERTGRGRDVIERGGGEHIMMWRARGWPKCDVKWNGRC